MESGVIETEEDSPDVVVGEVVHNENGDKAYHIIRQIGSGRCCVVYSGSAVRDGTMVALKFFRPGPKYEGAVQRERFILDNLGRGADQNLVICHDYLTYHGLHVLVLELLDVNIRQIIFKNDRHGLSSWVVIKFAKDILTALQALHQAGLVHGDLKPANILWSRQSGVFKCIDFGLAFSVEEEDLHQIQSPGYRSPESAAWNKYKDDQKYQRKRKLQGTYLHLNHIAPPASTRQQDGAAGKSSQSDIPAKNPMDIVSDSQNKNSVKDSSKKCLNEIPIEMSLQHCDSQSSGIFSQESCDRSQCSSRLSWDGVESGEVMGNKKKITFDSKDEHANAKSKKVTREDNKEQEEKQNSSTEEQSTVTSDDTICNEEAFGKFEEHPGTQDWRKSRRRSVHLPTMDKYPALCRPGPPSDIWSLGCLLAEALTGKKLFRAGDKLASVLRPNQLLEMKLGEIEVESTEMGQEVIFNNIKDLIQKCINEDPDERISAQDAINHPLFSLTGVEPSENDMTILPSPILGMSLNIKDDDKESCTICPEMLADLRSECEAYGEITECCLAKGSGRAYVHFQEVESAVSAFRHMTNVDPDLDNNISFFEHGDRQTNNEWIVFYFPLDLWVIQHKTNT